MQAIATAELGKDVGRIRSDADEAKARARVRALMRVPLSVESAVQIALLNNRGLQASFAELAATEAESVEASLPPSPKFSLARCDPGVGDRAPSRGQCAGLIDAAEAPRTRRRALCPS